MGGVYLDSELGLTTLDLPHRKWPKDARLPFYIARLPAGDYAAHQCESDWGKGYGGATVEFLMEDGTVEKIKGPFRVGCPKGAGDEFPGIHHRAFKIHVFNESWNYGKKIESVYSDKEWRVGGEWQDVVPADYAGFFYGIESRGCVMYPTGDELIVAWKKLRPDLNWNLIEQWEDTWGKGVKGRLEQALLLCGRSVTP